MLSGGGDDGTHSGEVAGAPSRSGSHRRIRLSSGAASAGDPAGGSPCAFAWTCARKAGKRAVRGSALSFEGHATVVLLGQTSVRHHVRKRRARVHEPGQRTREPPSVADLANPQQTSAPSFSSNPAEIGFHHLADRRRHINGSTLRWTATIASAQRRPLMSKYVRALEVRIHYAFAAKDVVAPFWV